MGGSSAIPPTASLFRERFIYGEQPFLRGYERATGRFWRKADVRQDAAVSYVPLADVSGTCASSHLFRSQKCS
jgi:hypothetical protein